MTDLHRAFLCSRMQGCALALLVALEVGVQVVYCRGERKQEASELGVRQQPYIKGVPTGHAVLGRRIRVMHRNSTQHQQSLRVT